MMEIEIELENYLLNVDYRVSPALPATRYDPPEPATIEIEAVTVYGADDSPREATAAEWTRWQERLLSALEESEATR